MEAGIPVGLLAYRDGEPVGWCSVAPKTTFGKLDDLAPAAEAGKTWSITCFFVRRDMREEGLMHALIGAAVAQARKRKARLVGPTRWTRIRRATAKWDSCRPSPATGSGRRGAPGPAVT